MDDRLVCAICLYHLMIPSTIAETQEHGRFEETSGRGLIQAVRKAADEGLLIVINRNTMATFYAATTVRGTAVCPGHLHEVMQTSRPGNPW